MYSRISNGSLKNRPSYRQTNINVDLAQKFSGFSQMIFAAWERQPLTSSREDSNPFSPVELHLANSGLILLKDSRDSARGE